MIKNIPILFILLISSCQICDSKKEKAELLIDEVEKFKEENGYYPSERVISFDEYENIEYRRSTDSTFYDISFKCENREYWYNSGNGAWDITGEEF